MGATMKGKPEGFYALAIMLAVVIFIVAGGALLTGIIAPKIEPDKPTQLDRIEKRLDAIEERLEGR